MRQFWVIMSQIRVVGTSGISSELLSPPALSRTPWVDESWGCWRLRTENLDLRSSRCWTGGHGHKYGRVAVDAASPGAPFWLINTMDTYLSFTCQMRVPALSVYYRCCTKSSVKSTLQTSSIIRATCLSTGFQRDEGFRFRLVVDTTSIDHMDSRTPPSRL